MLIRRCNVDAGGLNRVAVTCLIDRHLASTSEYVGQQAAMSGIEVLDNQDRGGEVRRELRKQLLQGGDTSGGCGDRDHVERGRGRRPL